MTSSNEPCVLCGQAVEISGFSLNTKDGVIGFCCEGCKCIYRLLNEDKLLPTTTEKNKK